jgi:deazaflavin-dependent oxidoreductase (nitroreductase family)
MNGNDFMSWILRSPVHGMLSNGMMLITVSGRKTGKKYTLPVGYYPENGDLWVITSRDRTWWRNLKGGAEVSLLLKRKPVPAFAEPEVKVEAVEARIHDYLKHVPQAARPMGIRVVHGQANEEDIARTAKDRLFIRIKPSPTACLINN